MENKNNIIPEYKLHPENNDNSTEIKNWLKKCQDNRVSEVVLDVCLTDNYKIYINRLIKLSKFFEHTALQYKIKINYSEDYIKIQNLYNSQTTAYQNNRNSYKDLYIDSSTKTIKEDMLYNNLFINTDNITPELINNLLAKPAAEEKLSVTRRAYLNSTEEITQNNKFDEIIIILLNLGYDIEFTTKETKYNKTSDEVLNSSYSVITFDTKSQIPFVSDYKKSKIIKTYKNIVLGEIKIL